MTYEKEIPEYALQPAKAPQFMRAEAIYHTEKMNYPAEKKTAVYQFEEDILVPDTKADMREILLMEAVCDIMPTEKKVLPKTDDLLNLTGMITIQTLYRPECGASGDASPRQRMPVAIVSKVPYKYQWNLNPQNQGEGVFSCRVKSLEHMVINERKFRVKVTLEFCAQLFCQQEISFFDGLKDEALEMKMVELPLVCLATVKQDQVSVDETFRPRDVERMPESILKQSFLVAENYRQVTTEKVVINGFIFVNLLYLSKGDEEKMPAVCEHHQRVEFTQFIPIEKEQRGKKWSTVKPTFSPRNLTVVIDQSEDESATPVFHIKGDIDTRIELYEHKVQKMVVDAYHREKNFSCKFNHASFLNLADGAIAEHSMREVVNLVDGFKAVEATSCDSRILDCKCKAERGKLLIEGQMETACLWKDSENDYHTTKQTSEFQTSVDIERLERGTSADCQPLVKNCIVSLINEKQLELNCTLLLCCESYEEKRLALLEEPGFSTAQGEKEYPMVVTMLKPGETLWDLAKRYRTTETQIRTANRMEGEPEPGQKLLVIK